MSFKDSVLTVFFAWTRSRRVQHVAMLVVAFFVVLTIMRTGFYLYFGLANDTLSADLISDALYIGLKFDLRLAVLLVLPVLFLEFIPKFNSMLNKLTRSISMIYIVIAFVSLLLFYFLDFGYYAYLNERLNASAMQFLDDLAISAGMVWQTYPVIWLSLLLCVLVVIFVLTIRYYVYPVLDKEYKRINVIERVVGSVIFGAILLFGIYGKLSWYPLRWSDAFISKTPFVNAVAINPVLYFYDTLHNKEKNYDQAKAEKYFPVVAKYLGVDVNKKLDFSRKVASTNKSLTTPNIVYVILESFGSNQYGLFGNTLDSTPYLDEIGKNSIVFDRFIVPTGSGTARSVFTAMTGIPDVYPDGTASHNPLLIDQHLIMDEFGGYDKYYFLGGSASWRNIRGFLTQNIKGLNLYEEGSYTEPRVDVWGLSDLSLFRESSKVLKERDQKKPFIAIIQTAANHRPFTIPEDNDGFEIKSLPKDENNWQGYKSEGRYNAVRMMDHSVGQFFEMIKNEDYFNNTIFVFHGDHGVASSPSPHMSKSFDQLFLTTYAVPLIIYSPGLIKEPKRIKKVVSEADVFPTLAGLAGIEYKNQALGRDILNLGAEQESYAPMLSKVHLFGKVGIMDDRFLLWNDHIENKTFLHDMFSDEPANDVKDQYKEKTEKLSELAEAFYETSRYMLYFNQSNE